jgi:DNA-binding NtrC family response regulator
MDDKNVVLLVEDEPLVRMLGADVLTEAGFRVIEAVSATEAIALLEARPDVLVLLSDVEMGAGSNGFQLSHAVHDRWPGIGIILTSGRATPDVGDMPPGSIFLRKPYPLTVLVQHVREFADKAAQPLVIRNEEPASPAEERGSETASDNVIPLRASSS